MTFRRGNRYGLTRVIWWLVLSALEFENAVTLYPGSLNDADPRGNFPLDNYMTWWAFLLAGIFMLFLLHDSWTANKNETL